MMIDRREIEMLNGRKRFVRLYMFKTHLKQTNIVHSCKEFGTVYQTIYIGQEVVCPYCHLVLKQRQTSETYSVTVTGVDMHGKLSLNFGHDKQGAVSAFFFYSRKNIWN